MKLPFLTRRAEAPPSARGGLRSDVLANVYLCHAPDAEALLARLDAELRTRGVVFSSRSGNPAQDDSRIDAADHFLFVVTPGSLASAPCRAELARARDDGKKILFLESGEPAETPPLPGSTGENHLSLAPADFAAGARAAIDRVDQRQRFDAFVSYAREDTAFVDRLAAALRRAGRKAWLDRADIQPAADWKKALDSGVAAADSFLYVISPDSVESPHCAKELEKARELEKLVIPVRCREMDDDLLLPVLGTTQYVDFARGEFQPALRQVLDAMEASPELRARLTGLLNRALDWRDSGQEASRLLDGGELRDALGWVEEARKRELSSPAIVGEYLEASAKLDHVRLGQAKRRRAAFALLGLVLLAAIPALFLIWRDGIAGARSAAARARTEAAPDQALVLALEALRIRNTPQGRAALFSSLARAPGLLAYLRGHAGAPAALVFTRGDTLLAATAPGEVTAWDGAGRPIHKVAATRGRSVTAFAASPAGDVFATGTGASELIVQRPGTRPHLLREAYPVSALAFSHDGRRLAVGTVAGALSLWDVTTAQPTLLARAQDSDTLKVMAVAFAESGDVLAMQDFGALFRWTGRPGDELERSLVIRNEVQSAVFSATGRQLAFTVADTLFVHRLNDGGTARWTIPGPPGARPLAFNRQEDRLVQGDATGTIRLVDLARGPAAELLAHTEAVQALAFTPDGRTLASGGLDGRVALWDVEGRRSFGQALVPPAPGWEANAVAGDGESAALAFAPTDHRPSVAVVLARSAGGGASFSSEPRDSLSYVADLRLLGPNRFLAAGLRRRMVDGPRGPGADYDPVLWDGAKMRVFPRGPSTNDDAPVLQAALSPNGSLLAIVEGTRGVVLRETSPDRALGTLPGSRRRRAAMDAVFSGDGRRIAAIFEDSTVLIWSAETRRMIDSVRLPVRDLVWGVTLDREGKRVAVGVQGGVVLLEVGEGDGAPRRFTGPRYRVARLAFSPDDAMLAATEQGGDRFYLWDTASGDLLGEAITGPARFRVPLAFTPDGAALIVGGATPTRWPMTVEAWRRHACDLLGSGPLPEEWSEAIGRGRSPCEKR